MRILLNENIRELCKKQNISLKTLSEKIGITQTGMQSILKNNSTSLETLLKISEYFNVNVYDFFEPQTAIEKEQYEVFKTALGLGSDFQKVVDDGKRLKDSYEEIIEIHKKRIQELEKSLNDCINLNKKQDFIIETLQKHIERLEKQIRMYENLYGTEKK